MKVLLVGSGGREHALASALAASPSLDELHCAPGNPGIAAAAACHPLRADDVEAVLALTAGLRPDLVVIGPEAPLAAGLGDAIRHAGTPVFGPGAAAARIETSKAFAKEVLATAGVATASYRVCATMPEVRAAVAAFAGRVAVKVDGLAAGKGVTVCSTAEEAVAAATACLVAGSFGEAGQRVVIEERLEGEEVSLLALCDGTEAIALPAAQDFKRLLDDDEGPNTGGMGAYSPVAGMDAERAAELVAEIHVPVLRELARRGIHFSGCLYAGLMLTQSGPRVIEFNARFGDPETQVQAPMIESDLALALAAVAEGRPGDVELQIRPGACVTVVLAAHGYPTETRSGDAIEGIEQALAMPGIDVYQAGTAFADGRLVTAGGRVLAVTARGATLAEARVRAYEAAERIGFDGKQARGDIAERAATRKEQHARA